MNIKEYWDKLVAAGLAPNWDNVWAEYNPTGQVILFLNDKFGAIRIETKPEAGVFEQYCVSISRIRLRKDGIDLHGLTWRKPTEEDIKQVCWYKFGTEITLTTFTNEMLKEKCKCLLADHGRLAPAIEDFQKVFGDDDDICD